MSFWTDLKFYRPGRRSCVSTSDVAAFVKDVLATRLVEPDEVSLPRLEYRGKLLASPDADTGNFNSSKDSAVVSQLRSENREIVSGYVGIGTLREDVAGAISRISSPEDEVDFTPHSVGFEIGSVDLFSLASDKTATVGTMGLSIEGPGYLWPWSFSEAVQKLEASREIAVLMDLCRLHWPLPVKAARWLSTRRRNSLGDLWPYEDLDRPLDWCWGLHET